jgi:hypothetical protein
MSKKDYRLFVDSDIIEPLPPIYKGALITFYPGQLNKAQNPRRGDEGNDKPPISTKSKMTGLRRYVFRYEGDKFVYLATRKGQRNGGFNSKPTQRKISIGFAIPGISTIIAPLIRNFSFTEINDDNEEVWTEGLNSIIKYNSLANRWEWLTRPVPVPPSAPPGQFFINAYTQSTSNPLTNTGDKDQIQWTYISDPWASATPEIPITSTTINAIVYFNNNSIENLNKWPIQNIDASKDSIDGQQLKWEASDSPGGRPDCLSDSYLKKCFQGVNLKYYDIVFVEVVWRYFANRHSHRSIKDGGSPIDWGYGAADVFEVNDPRSIHNQEWWSPRPFKVKRQKGRVYRVGGLEADTGVGGIDRVIWAQRTRVITTDYKRGGQTALE